MPRIVSSNSTNYPYGATVYPYSGSGLVYHDNPYESVVQYVPVFRWNDYDSDSSSATISRYNEYGYLNGFYGEFTHRKVVDRSTKIMDVE